MQIRKTMIIELSKRRVRTAPGGKDSIAALWGDEDPAEEEFKPTRRCVPLFYVESCIVVN